MSTDQHSPDLIALEKLAIDVAREAARLVVEQRAAELEVATKSSDVDIVTVMDSRSQELIASRLRGARPMDAFFGEEDAAANGGTESATDGGDTESATDGGDSAADGEASDSTGARSGLTWVVDPIDGTVNYLYGFPQYAVSIALVEGDPQTPGAWRPVVGAVADAVSGVVHHARLGGGAFTRSVEGVETRLSVSKSDDLATSLVATGFGYDAEKRVRQAHALAEIIGHVRDIRRGGSAALDLCHVAAGRVDAYYEMGINPWDMAAGWLVLTEAGGWCSGAAGSAPSKQCVMAGAPGIRAEFTALVDPLVAAVTG